MAKQPRTQPDNSDNNGQDPTPKGYEKIIANWTRILGVSTIALFLATAISAGFLYQTDETIKKQVEAAGLQLRAYVNFQQVLYVPHFSKDISQKDAPDPGANIGVTWKNFGSTPARETSYWISVKWYETGTEPDFSQPQDRLADHPNITLPPGGEIPTTLVFIPLADITKIGINNGKIFLWGDIGYRDYIPDSPVRHSHFCMYATNLPAVPTAPAAFSIYKPECNYTN